MVDTAARSRYEHRVAKKPEAGGSRIPGAVGAIPVVGDMVKQAEAQARWMQEIVEQNARLVGQLPSTLKSFNDALERFNQTVSRLDRAVTRMENATRSLTAPVELLGEALDPRTLRELPGALEALRNEALPALRAATDTQRQIALIQSTLDRVVAVVGELPGAGIVRRMTGNRGATAAAGPTRTVPEPPASRPGPPATAAPESDISPRPRPPRDA